MKNTGITRQIDELGRVVIPMELRRTLNIGVSDGLEIFVDKDMIIFRKCVRGCVFCGESDRDLVQFHGKQVCLECPAEIEVSSSKLHAAPSETESQKGKRNISI